MKVARLCNNTPGYAGTANDCSVIACDETTKSCELEAAACNDAITASVLAGSLSTAAIVGIVLSSVCICGGAATGSVYAATRNTNQDPGTGVTNNPLYDSPKMSKDNPLFQQKPADA